MPRKPSAPATAGPTVRPFIVRTSINDKEDPDTRKLIRSHVMRGKNKRKPISPPESAPKPGHVSVKELKNHGIIEWAVVCPRQIASELSLLGCGADLDPKTQELLFRAFTIVKPAMYSATQMFSSVSNPVKARDLFCPTNLAFHPAMVHTMSFTAQAFHDMSLGEPIGRTARYHLVKTLRLLQDSLADASDATSHSTMIVVASLASVSMMVGDLETASKHLDGLFRIFQLRRGDDAKNKKPGDYREDDTLCLVEQKARSTDVGIAIALGRPTRFTLPEDLSWTCQIASGSSAWRYPELSAIKPHLNPWLLNIWADLREFSRVVNGATKTGGIIPHGTITKLTSSIPSRLVNLHYDVESLSELFRLAMLAYTKTLLIKIKGFGKQLAYMAERLKISLLAHNAAVQEQAAFLFWVMFMAALSIFEELEEEGWLRTRLVAGLSSLGLEGTTWPVLRGILKKFLWVDMIHDDVGQELFTKISGEHNIHIPSEN